MVEGDLPQAIRSPSFTPGRAHLTDLLGLLGSEEEDVSMAAERAILRMGPMAVPALLALAPEAAPPLRGRLCWVLGRLASSLDPERQGRPEAAPLRAYLMRSLHDPDPKTQRNAVIALGRGPEPPADPHHDEEAEDAFIALWPEAQVALQRSLVTGLGKIGAAKSLAFLRAMDPPDDPELARLRTQAQLRLDRTLARSGESGIDLGLRFEPPPGEESEGPLEALVHCRAGLEGLLMEELGPEFEPRQVGPGQVRVRMDGPPEVLLKARTMLHFGFLLPPERCGPQGLIEAVLRSLASARAQQVFKRFTKGAARFRVAWAEGGHRRAAVWQLAQLVAERCPGLRNDPKDSNWVVRVRETKIAGAAAVQVLLIPRGYEDPRFAYRRGEVPAGSHPTVAAALARIAGVQPDDVIWDPFAGSGLELVERALLGPFEALYGSDRDERALGFAEANLRAAGVRRFQLVTADATRFVPPEGYVTLLLTNPPMGRRVQQPTEPTGEFLERFLRHATTVLAPGGRLVWISPLPAQTARRLAEAGMRELYRQDIDMGGFGGQIQVYER